MTSRLRVQTSEKPFYINFFIFLLAFIDKYGVPTNQWTWLYEALLKVSMAKKALWICACADDWAAESVIKASNVF